MRLSDADREALYDKLSTHHAAGRIELADLERRVAAIAAAQTREDAAAVMADLPPVPAAEASAGWHFRNRGHGHSDAPSADWTATNERFRDPRSKRVMRVWVDTAGGRHYVPDE